MARIYPKILIRFYMENNSFILDSSILIAFYNEEDSQHLKALKIVNNLDGKIIFVHPYVIEEVSTVLTYKSGVANAKKFLNNVLNSENVMIHWNNVKEEINFFIKLNKKISFTDSALVNLSKNKKIPLLTFDKQITSILKKI